MVKVLSEPKKAKEIKTKCKCGARLLYEKSEGRFVNDRDGDAYVFRCPCCRGEIWLAASVVDRG
jgi:predicted SprT family Zn-dependent metalloprotease